MSNPLKGATSVRTSNRAVPVPVPWKVPVARPSVPVAEPTDSSEDEDPWDLIAVDRHSGMGAARLFGVVYCRKGDVKKVPVPSSIPSWRSARVLLDTYGQSAEDALAVYSKALGFFRLAQLPHGCITVAIQIKARNTIAGGRASIDLCQGVTARGIVKHTPCVLCSGNVGTQQCAFNPSMDVTELCCRTVVCSSCRAPHSDVAVLAAAITELAVQLCSPCVRQDEAVDPFVCDAHTREDFETAAILLEFR